MKLFGNKSRNDDIITKGDLAEIKSDIQLAKSIAENSRSELTQVNAKLSSALMKVWTGTQTEYDEQSTKSSDTLYLIEKE